jgi:hypothetical protein
MSVLQSSNVPIFALGNRGSLNAVEGSKGIGPITITWIAGVQSFAYNFHAQQSAGAFSMALMVFIDNQYGPANPIVLTFDGSGQNISVPAGTQGYYPVLAPNPFGFTISSNGTGITNLIVTNTLLPATNWL